MFGSNEKIDNLRDDDAVSPVIGVILMVAITVILAAVVAAFVFGVVGQGPSQAPQATIGIDDVDTGASDITLIHKGGDSINASDTKINIDVNGAQSDSISSPNFTGGTLQVGDTYNTTTSTTLASGDQITVRVIDTNSQKLISELERTAP